MYDKSTPAGRAFRDSLKRAYLRGISTVHAHDRGAKVALGFTGQHWYPNPVNNLAYWRTGEGAAIHDQWTDADAVEASDFLAAQAMQGAATFVAGTAKGATGTSVLLPQVRNMVSGLHAVAPAKPIMISHFKVWDDDVEGSPHDQNVAAQQAQALTTWSSLER